MSDTEVLLDANALRALAARGSVFARSVHRQEIVRIVILRGWLACHAAILLGYAVLGRGFAYVGMGNLYVGEICLGVGVVWLATFRKWRSLLGNRSIQAIVVLQLWGAVCTFPYIGKYGIDALRDAVLWGYSLYAIIVAAAIISVPSILELFLRRYRLFAGIFLCCAPVAWCVFFLFPTRIPVWPTSGVAMISIRSSETLVHLAGVFSFYAIGLGGSLALLKAVLLVSATGMAGSTNRGGLLAYIVSALFATVVGGVRRMHLLVVGIAGTTLAVGLMCNVEIPISYEGRPISTRQLISNVLSTVTTTGNTGFLEDNKQWRLSWWRDIYAYTVNGPYFVSGKGFGVNLADDDGYQVLEDDSLRNPHNSHLTFLARSGVPGFAIWIFLQCVWVGQMTLSYWKARRLGLTRWSKVFLFVMCYWLASMINAAFDPALEGPMLGIWFWSIIGLGIGSALVCPKGTGVRAHQ